MRWLTALLLASCLAIAATPALAYVPQTINVDGRGVDWDQANLVQNDTLDTETKDWCTNDPAFESPMDIGKVYITNDLSFLYIGFFYDRDCFTQPNLGIAIDVNGAAGGTTDPFGRKISWTDVATKPDFVIYDVVDAFNFEQIYQWNGSSWVGIGSTINPSYGSGSNGLGIREDSTFVELKIPLSALGVSAGNAINVEWWMTQDGTTKGPLDAVCSDTSQVSTPSGTVFDLAQPKTMDCMIPFTILNAVDTSPPTVATANAVSFPLLATKQFGLSTNKVDVTFNEPVDLTTAETEGNYAVSGAAARTIISALRDPSATNVVHLTLNSSITANAAFYNLTVTGVKDISSNTIVANGNTNVGSFFIQNLVFNGNMKIGLCKGIFATSDTFAIEGSVLPLTFALTDNAAMTDANGDSIYVVTVPFALTKNTGTGLAEADLEWKFSRKNVGGATNEFEPGGNRAYHLSSVNGASVNISASWNNDDPANFTTRPVDVIFKVDAAAIPSVADSAITLLGNQSPLAFSPVPSTTLMKDDGVLPDQTAGDKIYTARVTFPICATKNVSWKVGINSRIECAGQGDRSVYLNDAIFSSANPIVLPARKIDFCTNSDKAVTVIFRVDMAPRVPAPGPADTVAIGGSQAPLTFNEPPGNRMFDNGVAPDQTAGNKVYTVAVTFPQGTPLSVDFKFWLGGGVGFECIGFGNRNFTIDDVNYSTVTPQLRVQDTWNFCSEPTGVPFEPGRSAGSGVDFAWLRQSFPNPGRSGATIGFDLRRAGRVTLTVYDVAGRRMARLVDRPLAVGTHSVSWDGRNEAGSAVKSGLYVYELAMDGQRLARHMVLTR